MLCIWSSFLRKLTTDCVLPYWCSPFHKWLNFSVKTKRSWPMCCVFSFAFSLLCTVTHFIVLFTLGETVKSVNQNIKSKHMWMRLSVAYDLPSSLSFSPFLSLFLTFPFISWLLSYCLSSKHSWLIWPWGPGLPASLRVSPSLTQLKPAGSSALGVIAYESPALPKDQLSLSIPASLPTKRRRTK